MENFQPKKIVIVGGGTAGWMAAHIFAKCWSSLGIVIEVVESPEIGIIGVGEGSTPQLKKFFEYIGVSESEWMPECNATYKNGISFHDWSSVTGSHEYFHPFFGETDQFTSRYFFKNTQLRKDGFDVDVHPNQFFLSAHLTEKNLAPIPANNFPFKINYGYHFDSGLLGNFLRKKAAGLGIIHTQGTVQQLVLNAQGDIDSLMLADDKKLPADFFIDCTGFSSLLLQKTLGVEFISFGNNLFNDSAVVMPTAAQALIKPQTVSTSLSNGWMWNIPLTNRCGNGYVYSSFYCSPDQAEQELRVKLGMLESGVPARHLKMKVGRVAQHWYKNCLAVGLSQGFIEPLEATALHLVQETIQGFADAYEGGGWSNKFQYAFNKKINHRFEGVRDYIVCHYLMNTRTDTTYWKDNAANKYISNSLAAILNAWFGGKNIGHALEQHGVHLYYQEESWQCLLAGYGRFVASSVLKKSDGNGDDLRYVRDFVERCGLNFTSHNEMIRKLKASPVANMVSSVGSVTK